MPGAQSTLRIPQALAVELDKIVGARRRSEYVVEVLWRDVRRIRQLEALALSKGAWKSADHPELVYGGAAYVEEIRSEADERFENLVGDQRR